jgi:phosphoribosyl 1,2-cyclic phosphate phosphodiesterase
MRITILGTGTSHGIPVIGCRCTVCRSRDQRDKRSRTSLLVQTRELSLLIDVAPEFRQQALQRDLQNLDAALITHAHADHIGGLDDLRVFSERRHAAFPIYGPAAALTAIRQRFNYAFRKTQTGGGKPQVKLIRVSEPFAIGKQRIVPVPLWHGKLKVFGYRIGPVAYLTDVSSIPEDSYRHLRGLEVVVIDALRPAPHETHFHLDRAIEEGFRIKARMTYFTHMCHLLGHSATERSLPESMHLAYDGLSLEL